VVLLVVAALPGCSGCHRSSDGDPGASSSEAVESRNVPERVFGARCRDGAECNSGVCFHFRPKAAQPGQQQAEPPRPMRHGFCSLRCGSDADCPSPPTSGHCGPRRHMCLKGRRHPADQQPEPEPEPAPDEEDVPPTQPTPPPAGS